MYASYYYVPKVELMAQKSLKPTEAERLMFIFANTFELLGSFSQFDVNIVYPML